MSVNTTSRIKEISESLSRSHDPCLSGWDTLSVPIQELKPSGLRAMISMWARPFTRAHRVPVFKRVWLYLALMTVYTLLVDWIAGHSFPSKMFKEAGAVSNIGLILGLLLVFRTNSAYGGWLEGRQLWGRLVSESRNLCLKVRSMVQVRDAEKLPLANLSSPLLTPLSTIFDRPSRASHCLVLVLYLSLRSDTYPCILPGRFMTHCWTGTTTD